MLKVCKCNKRIKSNLRQNSSRLINWATNSQAKKKLIALIVQDFKIDPVTRLLFLVHVLY